ncbi:MAG: DUF3344 domain-containing protein [Methanobacterium sp.]
MEANNISKNIKNQILFLTVTMAFALVICGAASADNVQNGNVNGTVGGALNTSDLVVTSIIPNSGTGDYMFANVSNVISVTVENQGTATAAASQLDVNVNGKDSKVNLPALNINNSTTVTVNDPLSLTNGDIVLVKATTVNSSLSTSLTVYNNGYMGERYTNGSDINTKSQFTGNYNVIYSNGNSSYSSNGWTSYNASWTAAQLPIPSGATITQVRLYQPYTWDQTTGGKPLLNVTLNGKSVNYSAWYSDTKGFGLWNYPSGLFVYDVTKLFNKAGNNLTITPGTSNNAALYGSYLIVVYHDLSSSYKTIYINDGTDILFSDPSSDVTNTEATSYANFKGINTNGLINAKAIAIVASAYQANISKFFFNGKSYSGFYGNYNTNSQMGFSVYNVTNTIRNGTNTAQLQSDNSGYIDILGCIFEAVYAPKVTSTTASNGAVNVALTSPITIKFTENIQTGTNYNKIYVKNLNTGKIVSITTSISGNTLTIKQTFSRLYNDTYQVYIAVDAVKDNAGNDLMAAYTFKFKTV